MSLDLRFQAVRSVLPGRPDRSAVDLELGSGRRVALIGGSGEGKSLLCRLAMGLPPRPPLAWEGSITLDERTIEPSALTPLRGWQIQWLPQGGRESLVPGWSLDRHIAHLAADRRDAILTRMQALGLTPDARVLGADAVRLSEGMIRRFLLAVATSGAPELLVLDEPTAGLDAAAREAVIAAVSAVDAGVLVATHDLAVAEALADRFVLVEHGAPVAVTDVLDPEGPLGHFVRAAAELAS